MGVIESALKWIQDIADDDSHGYDQSNRWGSDYDCSSLVISAFKQAGVPLACTYTGNMYSDMVAKGFKDVTASVNLSSGYGVQAGDVLLNHANHAAMSIGIGMIVQASSNENGGVTGGQSGDQTGREIAKRAYYNFPWNAVLRYEEPKESEPYTNRSDIHIVSKGETLWSIAEKYLGSGWKWQEIKSLNNLTSTQLMVGQVLRVKYTEVTAEDQTPVSDIGNTQNCSVSIPELKQGCNGVSVRCLQACLVQRGISTAINGDFSADTKEAVIRFQQSIGLSADGVVGSDTWRKLLE